MLPCTAARGMLHAPSGVRLWRAHVRTAAPSAHPGLPAALLPPPGTAQHHLSAALPAVMQPPARGCPGLPRPLLPPHRSAARRWPLRQGHRPRPPLLRPAPPPAPQPRWPRCCCPRPAPAAAAPHGARLPAQRRQGCRPGRAERWPAGKRLWQRRGLPPQHSCCPPRPPPAPRGLRRRRCRRQSAAWSGTARGCSTAVPPGGALLQWSRRSSAELRRRGAPRWPTGRAQRRRRRAACTTARARRRPRSPAGMNV